MSFEPLDQYLLTGAPSKSEVVTALLAERAVLPGASAFYEGMRLLGPRTPDLTLIALRLILAGKKADDAGVVALRDLSERARAGDAGAREAYLQSVEWNG
jgi:hypothetical protein